MDFFLKLVSQKGFFGFNFNVMGISGLLFENHCDQGHTNDYTATRRNGSTIKVLVLPLWVGYIICLWVALSAFSMLIGDVACYINITAEYETFIKLWYVEMRLGNNDKKLDSLSHKVR